MASKSTEYYRSNKKARERKKAYDTAYGATEEQKKRRAARNASRKKAIANGKISKNDSRDIHHVDGNPKNRSSSNLRAESKSKNRGRK